VLGCQEGQGFLFARPLDAVAATDWLAARVADVVDDADYVSCA
jgi:EAL domain-containing protein (putative c-di-GMP-specific phosphodiesterase class I)